MSGETDYHDYDAEPIAEAMSAPYYDLDDFPAGSVVVTPDEQAAIRHLYQCWEATMTSIAGHVHDALPLWAKEQA